MPYRPTGAGAFGFSLNWEKVPGDKDVARRVITFLEDRRLLFEACHSEDEMACVQSAIDIRRFLTEELTKAKPGRSLADSLRAMRAAMRAFVTEAGPGAIRFWYSRKRETDPFSLALGELRSLVGLHLAVIAYQYGIEVEPDLASILPPDISADNDTADPRRWPTEETWNQAGRPPPDHPAAIAARAAADVHLNNPGLVAEVLRALRERGRTDAVQALLARDPAEHAWLDDPDGVANLLWALHEVGASDAVRTLLDRDPAARASLDNPWGVAELLRALRGAGASDAVTALADRAAAQASLDEAWDFAGLLELLYGAGASDTVTALADRAAAQASLDNPLGVAVLLRALRKAGASDAARTLLARDPAARASLDDPDGVANLLRALREAGASDAARTLLDRDPAARASLDDRQGVAALLRALREAGASDAVRTLATRAANAHPWRWEEPGQLGLSSAEASLPKINWQNGASWSNCQYLWIKIF